jgi:hypothetical protein
MILRRVYGDPVQPGIEGAIATETRQCPVGLDEGLLSDIKGFMLILDVPVDELSNLVLVFTDETVESFLVTLLYAPDQFFV